MFKKVFNGLSNAVTLAFMGYEYGSHVNKAKEEESKANQHVDNTKQENADHNEIIIIVSFIIVILILAAIASKILCTKNRLV